MSSKSAKKETVESASDYSSLKEARFKYTDMMLCVFGVWSNWVLSI